MLRRYQRLTSPMGVSWIFFPRDELKGERVLPPIVQTLPLVGLGKEGSLFLVVVLGAQAFTLSLARPLSIAIIAVSAAVLKGRWILLAKSEKSCGSSRRKVSSCCANFCTNLGVCALLCLPLWLLYQKIDDQNQWMDRGLTKTLLQLRFIFSHWIIDTSQRHFAHYYSTWGPKRLERLGKVEMERGC